MSSSPQDVKQTTAHRDQQRCRRLGTNYVIQQRRVCRSVGKNSGEGKDPSSKDLGGAKHNEHSSNKKLGGKDSGNVVAKNLAMRFCHSQEFGICQRRSLC